MDKFKKEIALLKQENSENILDCFLDNQGNLQNYGRCRREFIHNLQGRKDLPFLKIHHEMAKRQFLERNKKKS